MHPTLRECRDTLDQLAWRSAVVSASAEALALRRDLRDLPLVPGRVSVITVCFNAATHIVSAFRSLEGQSYDDVEYIVVDGGSSDGTLKTIAECDRIDLAVSMRDKGIADAFNRGASLATGEFIAFLNADDVWPSDHLATAVAALRTDPVCAFVFGDLVRADEARDEYYVMRGDPAYRKKLHGWPPEFNHPSFLTRRSVFERVGLFDLDYRVCMDLEWLLRVDSADLHGHKAPGLWVIMRCGGISDQLERMFGDVRKALLSAGVSRQIVSRLVLRARVKTAVKQLLTLAGAGRLADRIRQKMNRQFEASDPRLVELARQTLRRRIDHSGQSRP